MRKIIFSFIMFFMAISAGAQTTFNIRAGAGVFDYKHTIYDGSWSQTLVAGGAILAQANIPFGKTSFFTFSPSGIFSIGKNGNDNHVELTMPLFLGYKIPTGNQCLFFPKIGPMVNMYFNDGLITVGPAAELALELKHFVISANVHLGLIDTETVGAFATVGYKF